MRLQAVLFLALLSSSNQHEIVKREASEKRVVCYYTNWSVYRPGTAKFNPQNINPYLCTHLIYAFGGLDRENGLRPYDKYQDIEQGGYAKFTGLKTYNKALKTMLAIGGWNEGSARFSPLVADEERRREFVKNVVKFLRINHFDGLDLDWEYPAFRDGGKAHDRENYAQLVQELREEFERESSKTGRVRLLLTMAVPAGIEYIDKGYDIPKLNQYLDFMNILTYDYHSAFEPSVNHHSPLYSLEEESEYNFDSQLTIDATIKHYLLKGADPDKLVLGIPTYGRSYTLFNADSTDLGSPADGPGEQGDATREKGYLAYYEICSKINDGWTVEFPKETAMGPYAYKGNQWVGYDDENIVKRKSEYVNERQLGGIMFWSIDNDDFRGNCHKRPYPLIEAAKEALLGKAPSKSSSSSRPNKLGSSKSSKSKNIRTTTSAPTQATPTVTTPDPPTTPDPGSDFVCKDEGFFPHPRDCKKYFWCLDSGPSNLGIVAHQFTCPSGLFFNKAADSCDFARNVICKKKSSTTTTTTSTTTPTTTTKSSGKFTTARTTTRTTTTTTTTTTKPPVEEEDEEFDGDSEEDPQTIKQLINLIKKLGGVAELERQLEGSGNSGSDSTTPSISKSLYDRVINKVTPKYQTLHRNGPSGPQNEGLTRETVRAPSHRRDKPQYVTIRRERPSSTTESLNSAEYADEYEAEEPIQDQRPKYKSIYRNNKSNDKEVVDSNSEEEEEAPLLKPERRFRPKYQPIERFRPKHQQIVEDEDKDDGSTSTLKYTNLIRSRGTSVADPTSSTSKYVTLRRQRPQQTQTEESDTTESLLTEEEEVEDEETDAPAVQVTTVAPPSSTTRPRVKVSPVFTTTPRILTSTRVVTQIVEGPTQRQRVPLHKLNKLISDSNNLIKSSEKLNPSTTIKNSYINRFLRKRPNKEFTTENPLQQRNQQIQPPISEDQVHQVPKNITKQRGFLPNRTRFRETVPHDVREGNPSVNRFNRRFRSTTVKAPLKLTDNEEKPTTESNRSFFRNRFRSTTVAESTHEEDGSDPLLSREYSQERSVIRRPVYKSRSRKPTTEKHLTSSTEVPKFVATEKNTDITEDKINQTKLEASSTAEINVSNLNKEQPRQAEHENSTSEPNVSLTPQDQSNSSTTESSTTSLGSSSSPYEKLQNETTESYKTTIADTVHESNQLVPQRAGRNSKPKKVLRRKTLVGENQNSSSIQDVVTENPRKTERKKTLIIRRRPNNTLSEVNGNFEERKPEPKRVITARGRTKFSHHKPEENLNVNNNESIASEKSSDEIGGKRKRILIRGKKKFKGNKDERPVETSTVEDEAIISSIQKRDNGKIRRVVLRKTIKDLAVGESGAPRAAEGNIFDIEEPNKISTSARGKTKLKDSLLKEDLDFTGNSAGNETIEVGRVRRPYSKRVISRGTTTTTTTEAPTTTRQRTTVHTLRQRLNKFRIDKTVPRLASESTPDGNVTVTRPRKTGIRRVIRPVISSQNIAEDSQLGESYSRSVSKDTNLRYDKGQYLSKKPDSFVIAENDKGISEPDGVDFDDVTDGGILLARQTIPVVEPDTSSESLENDRTVESSSLPDLANVAVAAIQSLATSAPTQSTEKYKITSITQAPPKLFLTTRQRPSRPPRPFSLPTSTPTTVPTRPRSSSPRPFTRTVKHQSSSLNLSPAPHRTSSPPVIYRDYDADYDAEPVDVPLSGKVRIHSDGYIECLDIGNFPHPFSCRKFISCAKMENGRLLGWEYTCPKGLSFDPIGGICNWNAGLGCKE